MPKSESDLVMVLTISPSALRVRDTAAPAVAGLPVIANHFLVTFTVTLSCLCFSVLFTINFSFDSLFTAVV